MKFFKNLLRRQARKRYKLGFYRKKILYELKNNKRRLIIIASAILLAVVLLIVLFSLLKNQAKTEETPTPTESVSEELDISEAGVELVLNYKSINDPYICGSDIVFSCGEANKMNPDLKYISVVDISKEDKTAVSLNGVECKFSNLFMPKISENWIVYTDSNSEGGGRICLYDRKAEKTYSLRMYYYAMPKVCLSGDYAAYVVQTGTNLDKIYLCYLPTQETALIDQLSNDSCALGGVYLNDSEVVWACLSGDSDATPKSIIKRLPLNGSTATPTEFSPGSLAYSPKTYGNNIIFLDGNGINGSRLMISDGSGVPRSIDSDVINFELGNGFIVYTKQEILYVYFIDQGIKAILTSKNSRGLLSSVNGDYACWYDITDGFFERDVVKYAKITVPEIKTEEDKDAQK